MAPVTAAIGAILASHQMILNRKEFERCKEQLLDCLRIVKQLCDLK